MIKTYWLEDEYGRRSYWKTNTVSAEVIEVRGLTP
jgi:hypothetical protein